MAGLSQLLSFAPPTPQAYGPMAPPVDPVVEAVKAWRADKATPEQKKIVGTLPASMMNQTSSPKASAQQELGAAGNVGAVAPKSAPPLSVFEASTGALPKNVLQDPNNPGMGVRTTVPQAPAGTVVPANAGAVPQPLRAPAPPMPISSMPIKPVNGTVPPTIVSSALVQQAGAKAGPQGAQKTAQAMDAPVSKEQVAVAQDAMDKFLKANPDGATLANILDAVGVAMSAYGGTQRQTGLQQRKQAQMQLAQQQALKQMDIENQQARAKEDFDRQVQLMDRQAQTALANGKIEDAQKWELEKQKLAIAHGYNIDEIKAQGLQNRAAKVAGYNANLAAQEYVP